MIEKKTKLTWKNLVKRKIKEFEFKELIEIKETRNQSKLEKLNYKELNQQEYLNNLNVVQLKEIFRFRTRMAKFSENFKEGGQVKLCPLCGRHDDTQNWSFKCQKVNENIEIIGRYEDIFESEITPSLANTVTQIMKLRETQMNDIVH